MNKDKEVESYLKGELPEEEKLKYEIAGELGLLDQVCLLYTSDAADD